MVTILLKNCGSITLEANDWKISENKLIVTLDDDYVGMFRRDETLGVFYHESVVGDDT